LDNAGYEPFLYCYARSLEQSLAGKTENQVVQVIVPANHPNPPESHEVEAAWILARHYSTVVEFLIPVEGYGVKSQDIVLLGLIFEMKSPKGNSRKHTVKDQFDRATRQHARNLVFDGRRTRLPDDYLIKTIARELSIRRRIRRVVFISKDGIVMEIP
jgi:hypothetical protein